jgi:hypothetical protein
VGEWDFELRPARPGVEPEDVPARVEILADRPGRRDVAGLLEEIIVRIDELASSVDRVNRRLAALEQGGNGDTVVEGETFGDVASRRLREARIARRLSGESPRAKVAAPEQSADAGTEPGN